MFGKFITEKLNRVLEKEKKIIVSVGLAAGLLAALACQLSSPTLEPTPAPLSEFISCRDVAISDVISIRE